jgi:hypothetical protein
MMNRWVWVFCGMCFASSGTVYASAHSMFEESAEIESALLGSGVSFDSGDTGRWDASNAPSGWNAQYQYAFSALPLSGKVESHQPWSDTYWPTNRGGIASRWNWGAATNGFKYDTFNEARVRVMSQGQLARLSPAEKYDIFMGRFDYPTVKMVRDNTSRHAEYWRGICHGWSPAALALGEPAPVAATSVGGIVVPFGSADVKGLIDNYYANNAKAANFLGMKCKAGNGGNVFHRIATPFRRGSEACEDVNAGAFHVILGNELGLNHVGFVADVERWREVWNQPVFAFNSTVVGQRRPSKNAAPGTVMEMQVKTTMLYADEIEATWDPVVGTDKFKGGQAEYEYFLELDAAGRILGGEWISSDRPDFLWRAAPLAFTGYFEGINRLYRPTGK